jgi:hypothetical protein
MPGPEDWKRCLTTMCSQVQESTLETLPMEPHAGILTQTTIDGINKDTLSMRVENAFAGPENSYWTTPPWGRALPAYTDRKREGAGSLQSDRGGKSSRKGEPMSTTSDWSATSAPHQELPRGSRDWAPSSGTHEQGKGLKREGQDLPQSGRGGKSSRKGSSQVTQSGSAGGTPSHQDQPSSSRRGSSSSSSYAVPGGDFPTEWPR